MTVARLVRTGMTNQRIGEFLGVSESSIRGILRNMFRAYEVVNRTELAAVFGAEVETIGAEVLERLTNLRVAADKRYAAATFGTTEYYTAVGSLGMIIDVISEVTAVRNHDESRTGS